MNILAIDPSLTGTAFALLELQGGHLVSVNTLLVDNSKFAKFGNGFRLCRIQDNLNNFIDGRIIDHVVMEKQFTRFNGATQSMFRVVGVLEKTLHEQGLDQLTYIAPTSVKKSLTGDGKADKGVVQECVRGYLPLALAEMVFDSLDCSDAVAVGIAFATEKNFLECVTTKEVKVEKVVKATSEVKTPTKKRKVSGETNGN